MRRKSQYPHAWGAAAVALFAAAALLGCVTPQIPLPPPSIEDISAALVDPDAGIVQLAGAPNAQMALAEVSVVNLDNGGFGVITPAGSDGSFTTDPFRAADGDRVLIHYRLHSELSDALCAVIRYSGDIGPCP